MNNNKKFLLFFSMFLVMAAIIINSCKKEEKPDPVPPPNPYDTVDYGGTSNTSATPDPNSFVGIHANILKSRCAMPGCHDGNFEPDFRTVQSAYSTLVYHKIKKNSPDSAFTFRVVPYDKIKSVLYERITNCNFVYQDDCMPQDNIGVKLPQDKIDNIGNWIMNGAKDMFGNTPAYPNTEPKILYYYATNSNFSINYGADANRMDSIFYNPFFLPDSTSINLAFFVEDDSTAVSAMQVNKLKISLKPDDFSTTVGTFTATYFSFPPNPPFHLVSINTTALPKSDTLFMRYFVNDGDHTNDTYFPTDNLPFPYKTYWSFYIKP